jgi:hypothetical protein
MVEEVDAQEKRARQEGKASGGGISGIAGGVGRRFFPPPPGRGGGYVIVELLQLYVRPLMGAFYVCLQRRSAMAGHATYQ